MREADREVLAARVDDDFLAVELHRVVAVDVDGAVRGEGAGRFRQHGKGDDVFRHGVLFLHGRSRSRCHGVCDARPATGDFTYSSNTARTSVAGTASPFSARSARSKNFPMRGSPFGSGLVVNTGCARS